MRSPIFAVFLLAIPLLAHADKAAISVILAVGAEGKGNKEASAAFEKITKAPSPETLLACLSAMDDASPLAANWLRSAAEVVASTCQAKDELPKVALGEFLLDRSHAAKARRFAFELIQRAEPDTAEALVPGMLNDPSPEMRRDAIARLMKQAGSLAKDRNESAATVIYRQALSAAVEPHQI